MKALVTGGTGFIGSHLVELLLKKGCSVRCLVRTTSDLTWLSGLPVEYIYGDLFDHQALRTAVSDVDYVYHSAGLTKAKTKEGYYRGNAEGTRNIIEAVVAANKGLRRFIHISSQAAAGPSPTKSPINESVEPHPLTTYGRSKWQAEQECLKHMPEVPITICRPPAVFGPRDKDVFEFFHTMSKGLQPMVGFGDKFVSLVYIGDLIRGFILAGESEKAAGQTYFISSKEVYSWKEIGEVTRKVMNTPALRLRIPEFGVYTVAAFAEFLGMFSAKPVLINFEKATDMVQNYWTCDSSKAKRDFGFEQEVSLQDGVRNTVEWARKQGWLR